MQKPGPKAKVRHDATESAGARDEFHLATSALDTYEPVNPGRCRELFYFARLQRLSIDDK